MTRRVPTALAKQHGRPGHRPLVKDEPVPATDLKKLKDPPEWLNDTQADIWKYAIEHAPPEVLRGIDSMLLASWCICIDFIRAANLAMGNRQVQRVQGKKRAHPLMREVQKQMATSIRLALEMGFTPASRPRLGTKVDPRDKQRTREGKATSDIYNGDLSDFIDGNPDATYN